MLPSGPLLAAGLALAAASGLARADCAGFKWDVSPERALFATAPTPLAAGRAGERAPAVAPGVLYRLDLSPEALVTPVVPPGKPTPAGAGAGEAFAGLVRFRVPAPGRYRVSLSGKAWIEVVDSGTALASEDFSGSADCAAPRKVVVYTLPAARELVLQVTAASASPLGVAITPASAPTAMAPPPPPALGPTDAPSPPSH